MSTNLQFIKSASGLAVSSLSLTNCFSSNYDVYQLQVNYNNASGNNNLSIRLLDSGGSQVSTSTYDMAGLDMNSGSSFSEVNSTGNTAFINTTQVADSNDNSIGNTYFYNPNNASYTFITNQQANITTTDFRGRKMIQVEKSTTQATGLHLFTVSSGTANIKATIYGVK
tara:strand:+ start:592 stop:1098 length:507 start_codon:yes stop_codon:yes gene_type:complete